MATIPPPDKIYTQEELEELRKQNIANAPDATQTMGEELDGATVVANAPTAEEQAQVNTASILADDVIKQVDAENKQAINQSVAQGEQEKAALQAKIREDQIREANTGYLKSLEGQMKEWEDMRKAQAARNAEVNRNTAWGTGLSGIGEAISALANLTGVGAGAVNQQPARYTQDWMRAADQDRRERQARLDNLEARQRAAKDNFIRAGLNIRLGDIQRQEQLADKDKAEKLAAAKTAWEQYKFTTEQGNKAFELSIKQAEAQGRINHQQAQDLIAQYNAETNRMNANSNAAYRSRMAGAAETRAAATSNYYNTKAEYVATGGGGRGNYSISFKGTAANGDNEKLTFQSEKSYVDTIATNLDEIQDWKAADKKTVERAIKLYNSTGDKKALETIKSKVIGSKDAMNILRFHSSNRMTGRFQDEGQMETADPDNDSREVFEQ